MSSIEMGGIMPGRTKSLTLLSLAVTLAGCSTAPPVSPLAPSNDPHFLRKERVEVDREYLDRYTCQDGAVLQCLCGSLQ
jgi:hypothetical protein